MSRFWNLLVAACLGLLIDGPGAANAAEIELRPDLAGRLQGLAPVYPGGADPLYLDDWNPQDWTQGIISVSGMITAGDADRLAALLDYEREPVVPLPHFVVLNSPGGSFLEGIKMGKHLQVARGGNNGPGLAGVYVLDGEGCYSACALAFILAHLPEDRGRSARFIEVGGSVGFHMPFLPPGKAAQETAISQAMDLTYDIMSEYLSIISNGTAPVALAQNALHYRQSDTFFRLRGGLVSQFMGVTPVAKGALVHPVSVSGLRQEEALGLCQYLAYARGEVHTSGAYEFWRVDISSQFPDDTPLSEVFTSLGSPMVGLERCGIGQNRDGTLWIATYPTGRQCPPDTYVEQWCPIDPQEVRQFKAVTVGLLADALGCSLGQLTRGYYDWDPTHAFLEEEQPQAYYWPGRTEGVASAQVNWQRRLRTNVNLRAEATASSGKVSQLRVGTEVQVEDCALRADSEGVWFQIRTGAERGWVSARYVSNGYEVIRPAGFE